MLLHFQSSDFMSLTIPAKDNPHKLQVGREFIIHDRRLKLEWIFYCPFSTTWTQTFGGKSNVNTWKFLLFYFLKHFVLFWDYHIITFSLPILPFNFLLSLKLMTSFYPNCYCVEALDLKFWVQEGTFLSIKKWQLSRSSLKLLQGICLELSCLLSN